MKTVGEYYHLHESYLDKAALDLEGVESFIQNENSFTIMPDGFQPSVRLQVSDEDFEKALQILQQLREEEE
ncbi:MAG: hypothetical protein ACI8RY_000564 [Urechidicola sp.]|jgi:hypothetical protein|tara:strand:+ start:2151 stop:2363 length:213 start_codon:yes stop_codon:yes gene_type:complete